MTRERRIASLLRQLADELDAPDAREPAPVKVAKLTPQEAHRLAMKGLRRAGVRVEVASRDAAAK